MKKICICISIAFLALAILIPSYFVLASPDIKSSIPLDKDFQATDIIKQLSVKAKQEIILLDDRTMQKVTFTRIAVINDESLSEADKIALLIKTIQELEIRIAKLEAK